MKKRVDIMTGINIENAKNLDKDLTIIIVVTLLVVLLVIFVILFLCGRIRSCVTGDAHDGIFLLTPSEEEWNDVRKSQVQKI